MLSKLSLMLCMLFCAGSAGFCQTTASISGFVRDPQGAVVPGATVALIGRDSAVSAKTVTDGAGRYRFEHVLPASYFINATAPGFERSEVQSVEAGQTSQLSADLHLRLAAVSTTIIVTSSGTAQAGDELTKAVSVVDSQAIDSLDNNSIADALGYVPGLHIQQLGGPGGLTSIKTRGLRSQDTAVLIDGFRFRDASSTQADASALLQDLVVSNVDRIEVLRGTGSSIYGTDATGGIINVITGTSGGASRGSVLLEGGSMDTFRGRGNVAGSLLDNALGYSLGIAHLNVAGGLDGNLPDRTSSVQGRLDYRLSNKTQVMGRLFITDSFSRITNGPTVAGDVPGTGVIDAVALASSELHRFETGTPVSALNMGHATFIPDYDDPDYNRVALSCSGALSVISHLTDAIGLTASYQGLTTHRAYSNGPLGAGYQPFGGTEVYDYDGTIHTITGRMDWRLGNHHTINAGYEFEIENYYGRTLEPDTADNSTANVTQRNSALFAQDQLHLLSGRLQIAGSYRAQFFSLNMPSLQPANSPPYTGLRISAPPDANTWDASVAYLFRQSGTKLRSHVGTGYRAPSLYERFGTYFSGYYGYTAYGNPGLKPERTTAVDAGIDQDLWRNRAQVSATYFYTRLHSVILFGDVDPSTDPYGRYYGYSNTRGGIARGVETSLSLTPVRTVSLQSAYTFTNAREESALVPGLYQTYATPGHQFSILATDRVTPRFTIVLGATLSSDYLAPIFDPVTYASRAYRFSGMKHGQIGASYRMPFGTSSGMRIFVNVQNAFRQLYYESGYRTPGMTAMSGIQFEF